jgi:hypothetical protein
MPRLQDAIAGLARRAWQGRSNPLLLTPLHFAPESRGRQIVRALSESAKPQSEIPASQRISRQRRRSVADRFGSQVLHAIGAVTAHRIGQGLIGRTRRRRRRPGAGLRGFPGNALDPHVGEPRLPEAEHYGGSESASRSHTQLASCASRPLGVRRYRGTKLTNLPAARASGLGRNLQSLTTRPNTYRPRPEARRGLEGPSRGFRRRRKRDLENPARVLCSRNGRLGMRSPIP